MMKLLQFVAQMVLGFLAVVALLLALALAGHDQVLPALAAVYVCCWAVQKGHWAAFRRRHGGKHA
jgi:hypothetical protein